MLVRDVVVVRQSLGYFPATFEYVVTLVADGNLTLPAYFCVTVSTTATPSHIFWAAEHGFLDVVTSDSATPLEGLFVWKKRIHFHSFVQAPLLPKIATQIVLETLLGTLFLTAVQKPTQNFVVGWPVNLAFLYWTAKEIVTSMTNVFTSTDETHQHGDAVFTEYLAYMLESSAIRTHAQDRHGRSRLLSDGRCI